jgi:hypothetical protein
MKDQPPDQGKSRTEHDLPAKGANTKGEKLPDDTKEHREERLDEGIEESFPASDPVSVKITK